MAEDWVMAESVFPDDTNEGTYGYCTSYDRLPKSTWLKVNWMEKDQFDPTIHKMELSTRGKKLYQVWISPRILTGLKRYWGLLEEERFLGKNIYFKYYGKKPVDFVLMHDFRLIIH